MMPSQHTNARRIASRFFRKWNRQFPAMLAKDELARVPYSRKTEIVPRLLLAGGLKPGSLKGRVLDLGTGRGQFAMVARKLGAEKVIGLDVDHELARHNVKEGRPAQVLGRTERIPFARQSFRVVTAGAVLEHSSNPKKVIREMARVLKPNGTLILELSSPPTVYRDLAALGMKTLPRTWFEAGVPAEEAGAEVARLSNTRGLHPRFDEAHLREALSPWFTGVRVIDLGKIARTKPEGLASFGMTGEEASSMRDHFHSRAAHNPHDTSYFVIAKRKPPARHRSKSVPRRGEPFKK